MYVFIQRHGKGKLTYSTGQVYDGEFVNDNINGEGEMKYSKVSKYQGGWVTGLVRLQLFAKKEFLHLSLLPLFLSRPPAAWLRCHGV